MASAALIMFMIVTIALLFTAMVLSAMASSDAQKGGTNCKEGCHKYSMWAALVTGISVAAIIVILIVYIYTTRNDIARDVALAAQERLLAMHQSIGEVSGVPSAGVPGVGAGVPGVGAAGAGGASAGVYGAPSAMSGYYGRRP